MAANNWILIIVGTLLGGTTLGLSGALLGGICGYLIGRVNRLSEQITQLRQDWQAGAPGLGTPTSEREPGPAEVPGTAAVEPTEPATDKAASVSESIEPEPETISVSTQKQLESEPETDIDDPWAQPPHKPGTGFEIGQRILNWFTQGNPLVRIGIVILFFGVSFLVKYAAEKNVLPIELRLAAVALGAVAVLVTGWRLRHKPGAYGLVLQGGAVAVLYLTVFGAAKLYHLLPPLLAFALMVALVALSGMLAVLQNAKALALFGVAGGFVTPILLSSGSGSHVALFSYYAVLNAGILGIAWFKSWRELNLLGFVFTFVIGAAWGHNSYRPELFNTTEPFLVLFFLFYLAISVLFAYRQPPQLKGYIDGSLVFGVPLIGFTLQGALVRDMEYGLAFSALSLSAIYIFLARTLWKRQIEGMRLLTEAFLALGIVFGSLAVPLALDGRWTAATWALEGAALVWVGLHQQRRLARWFGLLLQFGAGVALLITLDAPKAPLAVWNGAYLGGLVVSLAGLFSSWQLQRHKIKLMVQEQLLALPVFAWGLLWWCGIGLREVELFLDTQYEPFGVLSTLR